MQDVPAYSDVEADMLRTDAAAPAHDAATMAEWGREFRTRLSDIGTLPSAE